MLVFFSSLPFKVSIRASFSTCDRSPHTSSINCTFTSRFNFFGLYQFYSLPVHGRVFQILVWSLVPWMRLPSCAWDRQMKWLWKTSSRSPPSCAKSLRNHECKKLAFVSPTLPAPSWCYSSSDGPQEYLATISCIRLHSILWKKYFVVWGAAAGYAAYLPFFLFAPQGNVFTLLFIFMLVVEPSSNFFLPGSLPFWLHNSLFFCLFVWRKRLGQLLLFRIAPHNSFVQLILKSSCYRSYNIRTTLER